MTFLFGACDLGLGTRQALVRENVSLKIPELDLDSSTFRLRPILFSRRLDRERPEDFLREAGTRNCSRLSSGTCRFRQDTHRTSKQLENLKPESPQASEL